MPILSIIVPVYNVEEYIHKCIDSILSQPFSDFELIIVNDGSTDNSGKICNEYASKDSRIKVIHKVNEGQGYARNAGLDYCSGEYISFIDADDYISSDLYEQNIPILLKDKSIDILEFPITIIKNHREFPFQIHGFKVRHHLHTRKEIFEFWSDAGAGVRGFVWQNIYAARIFDNIRFAKMYYEDCEIQSRLLDKVNHVYLSGLGNYYYVQRDGSTLHSPTNICKILDDFKATIPYIKQLITYNAERNLIVKCWITTTDRLINKYVYYGSEKLKMHYNTLNNLGINYYEILKNDSISSKIKIKIIICKIIGLDLFCRMRNLVYKN